MNRIPYGWPTVLGAKSGIVLGRIYSGKRGSLDDGSQGGLDYTYSFCCPEKLLMVVE